MTAAVSLATLGNGPAFSAYLSAGQSIPNNIYTKVLYDTEEFDTNSNFASSRFTPTVAGYYQFSWAFGAGGITTNGEKWASLYKNGTRIRSGSDSTASYISAGSALVYMNGTTDYAEVYFYQLTNASQTSYSGAEYSFSGFLARGA